MKTVLLIIFICVTHVFSQKNFRDIENSELTMKRLIVLMMNYARQAQVLVDDMDKYRGLYDASPHFEMGYVMSELLERYRKLVKQARHPLEYHSDTVMDTMKTVELVQKLFLEVYHLVNMIHEIPTKYGDIREFQGQYGPDKGDVVNALERLQRLEKEREKRRKQLVRDLYKQKELYELQQLGGTRKPRKPANKWWPIDYGWEIDYYW